MLIPLCLGNRSKAFYFSFICSVSSIIGGIFGYYIGKTLWWNVPDFEYSSLANLFFEYVPGVTIDSFNKIKSLAHLCIHSDVSSNIGVNGDG